MILYYMKSGNMPLGLLLIQGQENLEILLLQLKLTSDLKLLPTELHLMQ